MAGENGDGEDAVEGVGKHPRRPRFRVAICSASCLITWFDGAGEPMEEVRCEKCGAIWLSPTALDADVSHEVASLIRGGNPIAGIRRLREATGLGPRDAKGVELHVTREPGKCQRCGADLVSGRAVACSQCQSLNYDW
jgi:hypothetical protein